MIAIEILRQENQVKVCFFTRSSTPGAILAAARGDVGLATNNRFNPMRVHRVVKRDRAIHIAVIGHGARFHPQFLGALGERIDLNGSVEEAVIGMKVEMYEVFGVHDGNRPRRT